MKNCLFIFLLFQIWGGCDKSHNSEITAASLEQQMLEIKALIDSGKCTQQGQCKFIAYGSKACGGPQGYLIFSTEVDEAALKKMVQEYTKAEDIYNKQNGIVSDCSLPAPPRELTCNNGKCIEIQ